MYIDDAYNHPPFCMMKFVDMTADLDSCNRRRRSFLGHIGGQTQHGGETIVLSFDGINNQFPDHKRNVLKLFSFCLRTSWDREALHSQQTSYNPCVGTYSYTRDGDVTKLDAVFLAQTLAEKIDDKAAVQ